MKKRWLTKKESRRLIKLGVPGDKASKVAWEIVSDSKGEPLSEYDRKCWWKKGISEKPFSPMNVGLTRIEKEDIFTLDDILDILPKALDLDNCLQISMNPIESVVYYESYFDEFHVIKPELIDALFELLIWVIKKKKICFQN